MMEINLRGHSNCERLWSRLIWQKLFDIYREIHSLENMNDMLCDLYSLERWCGPIRKNETPSPLFWHTDNATHLTMMADFEDPTYDIRVKIQYHKNHKLILEKL